MDAAQQATINETVVSTLLPAVLAWFQAEPLEDVEQVREALTLALEHSGDCYERCRYLDSQRGWPVDADLVIILQGAVKVEAKLRNRHSIFDFLKDKPANVVAFTETRFGD